MAEGSSKDVNEMFKKMGEKLGWFQHKDLETALKSVRNFINVNLLKIGTCIIIE